MSTAFQTNAQNHANTMYAGSTTEEQQLGFLQGSFTANGISQEASPGWLIESIDDNTSSIIYMAPTFVAQCGQ